MPEEIPITEPLTVAQIAQELGVSERAVQVTIQRALKKLRDKLSREDFKALLADLHPRERE